MTYHVAESSEYCKECICRSISCDLIITPADFARLTYVKEKLRKQLEEVKEQIFSAFMARIYL